MIPIACRFFSALRLDRQYKNTPSALATLSRLTICQHAYVTKLEEHIRLAVASTHITMRLIRKYTLNLISST